MTDIEHGAPAERPNVANGIDGAWAMTADLLAGVLTWGLIGYFGDRFLNTTPWLFVAGVLGGAALGTYMIFVRARRTLPAVPAPITPGIAHDIDLTDSSTSLGEMADKAAATDKAVA